MRKNILVIAPGYTQNSTDPCCKEIYRLIHCIANKKDYNLFILTSHNEKSSANINCFRIDQYNRLYSFIESINPKLRIIKKCANRLLEKKALKNIRCAYNYGHSPYFMNYEKFEKWVKKHIKLCKNLDFIFSFSNPFYQHEYCFEVIKHNPDIIWFSFFYDTFSDSPNCNNITKAVERENRVFQRSNQIFALKEIIDNCKNSKIKSYEKKLTIISTTTIVDRTIYTKKLLHKMKKKSIDLFYSGRFDKDIRNPKRMLEILCGLPNSFKVILYSKGCEDLVLSYKQRITEFEIHNFLENETDYNKKVASADFLLIVGNSFSSQMPSKFIEYISFGKPIIYFQTIDNDPALKEYSNYPLLLVISNEISTDQAVLDIQSFCKQNVSKTVDYDIISKLFPSNTLDSFAEMLINKIDG